MTKIKTKPRIRTELYKAKDGWHFRAIAGNGRIVGASEEGIKQRAYQLRRAASQFPDRPVIIVDADGSWEPAD